jgi:hypothetical protein
MRRSEILSLGWTVLFALVVHVQNVHAADKGTRVSVKPSCADTSVPDTGERLKNMQLFRPSLVYLHASSQNDSLFAKTDSLPKPRNDSNRSFRPMKTGLLYLHSASKVGLIHAVSLISLFSVSKERTNWEYDFGPELFRHTGENLIKAWTSLPRWDDDPFITNYVQHPYAGSFYYNLVRNKGASWSTSFAFSVISSTVFEYFTEAMFERPSVQDLFVTPVIGSLLGEGSHQLTLSMARNGFNAVEKIAVLFINPAYVLNHGFKVPTESRRKQLKQSKPNVFKPT